MILLLIWSCESIENSFTLRRTGESEREEKITHNNFVLLILAQVQDVKRKTHNSQKWPIVRQFWHWLTNRSIPHIRHYHESSSLSLSPRHSFSTFSIFLFQFLFFTINVLKDKFFLRKKRTEETRKNVKEGKRKRLDCLLLSYSHAKTVTERRKNKKDMFEFCWGCFIFIFRSLCKQIFLWNILLLF